MSRYGRRFSMVLMLLAPTFAWSAPPEADVKDSLDITGQLQKSDPIDPVRRKPAKVHEVKLLAGKSYQIDLMSTDFDAYLRLVDSLGKQIAFNDDGGENRNARIKYRPTQDATFKLVVTTFGSGEGAYTLKVQAEGAPVAIAAGAPETVVLKVTGNLKADDNPDPSTNRPAKIHELKLKKGTPYQIDLQSVAFDTYMRLVDDTGREIAKDDDGAASDGEKNFNSRIRFTADKDATYKIYAQSFNDAVGDYALTVKTLAGKGPAGKVVGNVTELPAPTADKAVVHQGQVLATDGRDPVQNHPAKVHVIELKGGKTYVIDLLSQWDNFLRIEGPNGAALADDDDGGEGLNARIVFACPADGRYRIIATSFGGRTGAYNLQIAEQP